MQQSAPSAAGSARQSRGPDRSIGRIVSVTGSKAIVLLDGSSEQSLAAPGGRPEMGTLLAIVSALSVPVPGRSALAFGKQEEVSSRKKVTSERCGGVGSWPLRRNRRRVILGGSKGREGKMKEIFFSSPPTRLLFSRVFSLTHFFQKIRRAFSSLLFLQRP